MKHYSTAALKRAAKVWPPRDERDMVAHIRSLVITDGKPAIACRLGITEVRLTGILRGRFKVEDRIAERLGYRRVIRFEPIS